MKLIYMSSLSTVRLSRSLAKLLIVIACLLPCTNLFGQNKKDACAEATLVKSLEAMGGTNLLQSINSYSYSANGYQNALEQSERYEGPYIPLIQKFEVTVDLKQKKLYQNISRTFPGSPLQKMTVVVDSGLVAMKRKTQYRPHFYQQPSVKDELDFSLLTILQTAQSSGAKCGGDTVINNVSNHIIAFKTRSARVRLFVNSVTFLLTATEINKPYDENYLSIWGDSRRYVHYSFWELFDNGVHFPLQNDVWINGKHYETSLAEKVEFNKVNLDSVAIPPATKGQIVSFQGQMENQFTSMMAQSKEIAKNIWFIPGPCNVTVVDQGNDLIVIDAPLSSQYSTTLLKKIKEMLPGRTIRTVVSTSDAWLHMGGLREFVANDIPLTILKENTPVVQDLLRASYQSNPDALQKTKKKPNLTTVSAPLKIAGKIEMKIVPFRTEAGERMMMVYFPAYKLLYASDLFQPKTRTGKYFELHYIFEVHQAIQREKLDVELIYGMHSDLVKYADIKKDLGVN